MNNVKVNIRFFRFQGYPPSQDNNFSQIEWIYPANKELFSQVTKYKFMEVDFPSKYFGSILDSLNLLAEIYKKDSYYLYGLLTVYVNDIKKFTDTINIFKTFEPLCLSKHTDTIKIYINKDENKRNELEYIKINRLNS
ncbi:Hypothetical protein ORPV_186 [Orpheovirus IHUMI-LCC2]|uniref:Uncharacterized protein n=1 Tax=Orpheovirus IHUMI-LCC2 TaxID=2023057 RepID=A0A2I2L3K5_9VIRU|nr:Hypothetical protein ORPV_186 [Orpheovirus IHUMI-LCC2]SNW62090.1 Hypothetical protein ORPV_186 [Orpheovirus IHUMI-LCC2]